MTSAEGVRSGTAAASLAAGADARDAHFDTAHLAGELKTRSVRGGVYAFGGQVLTFALQMGSTMLLARMLTPTDFGLVVMVTAITGFVAHFQEMGLSAATIQGARVTHRQASTLFWINVSVGAGLVAVVAALGPVLSAFYHEPRLTGITAALSMTFLLGGLSAQHMGLLRRQMRFQALAVMNVASLAVGVLAALLLAWHGAGYWALVAMTLATTASNAVLSFWLSGWRPGLPGRAAGLRGMLVFGANYTGFNLLNYMGRHADKLLIGRYWGAAPAGLYSRAYSLLLLPLTQLTDPIGGIAMPVLSRLQHDPERYRRYYYRAVATIAYLTFPLIVLMGVLAEELILFFLGDQWREAIDIFRLLALAAILQPILVTASWVWTSLGRVNELFRWSMLTAPAFLAAFVAGLPWGPAGVALAYAVCVNLLTPVGMAWCYRGTGMSLSGLIQATWRPFGVAVIIGCVAIAAREPLADLPVFLRLVGSTSIAVAAGAAVVLKWSRARQEVAELLGMMRELRMREQTV
jgi:O-antigen/teichoic acid export membrane protein